DKKKVVVTEAAIREVLRLDDAEGIDCLPNEDIFTELAIMGYEKPSTKLTFYKAFFSSQWKFLIHTVLQSISAKQTSWNEFSSAMASAVICLSTGQEIEEEGDEEKQVEDVTAGDDAQGDDTAAHGDVPTDKIAKVVESDQVQGRQAESQAEIYIIDMDHASKVLSMQEDEPAEVQEVVDVITTAKLITKVVTAASETVTADKVKGILVEDPKPLKKKQQVEMDVEYARKLHAELNKDIDWDVAIDHVKHKAKEDPAVKRYQAIKRKPQTEAQAQKNMIMYLKNVVGFKLDYFKGMSYDDIRPIFKAKFNSNADFLLKTKEQMEEEESRALQTINETPTEKAAKRRKLNKEVKDLKRHLEIVPDEDDDVYTEATPLARNVPVMDYEIIEINNKPYYKIIRADGTHQLYISFLTLLKNFNREDLEALWNLVKERFSTSKPKNFSNDFLLTTLGAMFEKPYALA
nr:hypothetical protein [Tanacetum cinerariifolium]